MRIIPAIDIIDGQCVRLTKGDYNTKKMYNQNPVEVAKSFEDHGIQYVHLVDLDGAKSNDMVNFKTLETLARETNLKIDFGGGIKSLEAINSALNAGAQQITLGSVAVHQPSLVEEWLALFGSEKLILGADCRERKIATNGWLETSELDIISFLKNYSELGFQYAIVTDIEKDGMLEGPSFELYREILQKTHSTLIASGGIHSMNDLHELKALGCEGAILGKALYEGYISLKELSTLC